jgi:DNA repair exonuclease SbcCD nuclease subunit
MSRQKIVDHQLSGKQKVAVTRTKDRNLDSLESPADKKIQQELHDLIGEWAKIGDKNVNRLLRRHETEAQRQKRLAKEALAKKQSEQAQLISQQPKELTKKQKQILKVINQKEKRLLAEIMMLEQQGKKKVAMNRRMQLNQTKEKKKHLLKGTVYESTI